MVEDAHTLENDSELIARAQGGEVEAFGELYQRYLDLIYRYIRVRVAEDRVAEDLTEAVFLRSFEALGRYKERGRPFSAFLYQVARNLLVDHYRQKKEEVSIEDANQMATSAPAVDEQVIQSERIREIGHALASLPSDYQEVIRLRVILALSTADVAAWMGRSEGAIRVLLHRALAALRRRLVESDE
jgi:RNA polymerase sigma-70 factor (ECF subfamily)